MSLDVYLYFPVDVGRDEPESHTVYEANITHNLNKMADEAGIYDCLWRPDEHGIERAEQIIEPLSKGLADLRNRPQHYEQFSASNGWGTYKDFVPWCERYLEACREYPKAFVRASR